MPKFAAESSGPVASTFSFSAVEINTLSATEYTLVGLITDCSGSVSSFARQEEVAIKEVIGACRRSPRADNLMIRYTRFDSSITEVHGFKLLQSCNPSDYDNTIPPGGMTALYDAAIDGIEALARYGRELQKNDFSANAIAFVITDGDNNEGLYRSPTAVKGAIEKALQEENLESIVTILIGVNVQNPNLSRALQDFSQAAGFSKYVELQNADEKSLSKLAEFVSKSISTQSQALGTGGPSQQLPTI